MNLLETLVTEANFISDCKELQFDSPILTSLLFGEASVTAFLYSSRMVTEG